MKQDISIGQKWRTVIWAFVPWHTVSSEMVDDPVMLADAGRVTNDGARFEVVTFWRACPWAGSCVVYQDHVGFAFWEE